MKTMAFLALIMVLAFAAVVSAATPMVTLGITTSGNRWQLYGLASNDCAGLVGFDVSFGGGGLGQVSTATQRAPRFTNSNQDYQGFHGNPSDGTVYGGAVRDVFNDQSVMWDPASAGASAYRNLLVLQGVGVQSVQAIDAGDGSTLLGTVGSPVLLAQGTFTGQAAFAPTGWYGNVLSGSVGSWAGPGNVEGANCVFQSGGSFPFPTGAGPSLFYNPCDANLNAKVDFSDYIILEANFGKTGATRATGDFNGDGTVTFADYVALELNFGEPSVVFNAARNDRGPNPAHPADFNWDYVINGRDWLVLERNFGHSGMAGRDGDLNGDGKVDMIDVNLFNGWMIDSPQVPEPASIVLVAAGAAALLRRRR